MKAFEEWRDREKIGGRSHKADVRVWKAALEWALCKHHEDQWELEGVLFREIHESEDI